MSRSTIAKLESSGRNGLSLDEAYAIADVLGTTVDSMVGDDPVALTVEVP